MDLYEEYGKGNMGVKPRNVDDGREPEEGERDADRKGNAFIIKEDNTDERTLDGEKEEVLEDPKSALTLDGGREKEEVLEDPKSAPTLDGEREKQEVLEDPKSAPTLDGGREKEEVLEDPKSAPTLDGEKE